MESRPGTDRNSAESAGPPWPTRESPLVKIESGDAGRLISCLGEQAKVARAGRHETWARNDCEVFTQAATDEQT